MMCVAVYCEFFVRSYLGFTTFQILALKQKLHETEMKLARAERERDSARQELQDALAQLAELRARVAQEVCLFGEI